MGVVGNVRRFIKNTRVFSVFLRINREHKTHEQNNATSPDLFHSADIWFNGMPLHYISLDPYTYKNPQKYTRKSTFFPNTHSFMCTKSHSVENSLWKRLQTSREADHKMNEWTVDLRRSLSGYLAFRSHNSH